MEFFRRWGIADKIRNAGWPGNYPLDVVWVTKVGGHEVYRLDRGTADSRPLHVHTPEPEQICPAHWLTPLLTREVGVHPDGPLRMRCKLDGFIEADDHVVTSITDLTNGSVLTVQAQFMIACDGASSPVRKACDIASPARHETRVFRNILFLDLVAPAPASPGWRPDAVPGSRAPHAWLRSGVSTLDWFGPEFSLLRFAESDRSEKFERAFVASRVPLKTTVCGDVRIASYTSTPLCWYGRTGMSHGEKTTCHQTRASSWTRFAEPAEPIG
jgi:2-polyprenyl-6-methoxyphenol hydroxylase-like FAD-dependent oxidoreductase